MERGGAKLKDFTLKQKIISFIKQCIFIEGWMEFECQVLSLTFSQGACSQDCIFLMKTVQAGSLISEMELLWYCFTLQNDCVVLKGLFFPQSAIFSWILFFACHIPFCYLCGASLTVSDLLPLRSSVWPLGRRFFFPPLNWRLWGK